VHKPDLSSAECYRLLKSGYDKIVMYMQEAGHYDQPNMQDTAKRAAIAMLEMTLPRAEICEEINRILHKRFPAPSSSMVTSLNNRVVSLCPHHLLPVMYHVDIAYVASTEIGFLGISKLTRIATLLGKAPLLQEEYTRLLADALCGPWFPSLGSAVRVSGWHSCLALRGAKSQDTQVTVTELRGCFLEDSSARVEFFNNLLVQHRTHP